MSPMSSIILRARLNPRAGFQFVGAAALVATGTFRSLRSTEDGTKSVPDRGILEGSASDCQSRSDVAVAAATSAGVDVRSRATAAETRRSFTPDEVAKRNGVSLPEMWVSYRGNVYDVTNFARDHPGGEHFLRGAAGGPLEPYWAYWAYHTTFDRAPKLLSELLIGTLAADDEDDDDDDDDEETSSDDDLAARQRLEDEMYESDPRREGGEFRFQIPLLRRPFCSETDPKGLRTYWTHADAFYVRNHAPAPDLDWDGHDVSFECDDVAEEDLAAKLRGEDVAAAKRGAVKLDLDRLRRRYDEVAIPSVLQCAGNRADEMMRIAPTAFEGTPFETIKTGMIGNALWSGVRLRDVLLDVFPGITRLTNEEVDSLHVEFEGTDEYRTSTPLKHVLDESSDVLLAFGMNGEALPADHGFPVRAFLPGLAGARSVKWLYAVRLRTGECDSTWNRTYYLDPNGDAIQRMPIQSFMTSKRTVEGKDDETRAVKVTGVAWGGGEGKGVDRVQVSSDGGASWTDADIEKPPERIREVDDSRRRWSWVQFEATVALRESPSEDEGMPKVVCRAFDSDGATQPEKRWYPKGYLYNGWHEL